jgi:hypothetical protein
MKAASTIPMTASEAPTEIKYDKDGRIIIDLEGEITRMAARAKVPLEDINKEHITSHYQLFGDAVRQYYKGVNDGQERGVSLALQEMPSKRFLMTCAALIYIVGAATYPTLKLLVKFVLLVIHFYNN